MIWSRIALVAALLIVLFTRLYFPDETLQHETLDFIGYLLTSFCALGRLYATAFLGGFKNRTLITYGAFSVVRNPLYFFSLVGVTGIALMSNHLTVIIGLPVIFVCLYHYLIKREEAFLTTEFGDAYRAYVARVPRLLPKLSLYQAPETVETTPRFLNKALKDAVWWFMALPVFELVEVLQANHWLPTFY